MRKLARSSMPSWKLRQVEAQGGLCPLNLTPLDKSNAADICIDHDHQTGEIRGVLSRAGNACEGKVRNAIARWGRCGDNDAAIIAWMKRMIEYLEKPGTGLIYHNHKTPEEKAQADKLKARQRAAKSRANRAVRGVK